VARRTPDEPARTAGLAIRPLTDELWPAFTELFGANGACGGCWCMLWRVAARDWDGRKGAPNRAAMRRLVRRGPPPGVLALEGERAIGWCAVAPRSAYPRLASSRVLRPIDERPVWSVSCLFVARNRRRRGVSAALLRGAAEHARACGATVLEGYPVVPGQRAVADVFAWTGTLRAFEAAGFTIVHRWKETRPIVRLELRAAAERPE
jgi:GNAT superfamily N-acetyltransferase